MGELQVGVVRVGGIRGVRGMCELAAIRIVGYE